MMMHDASPQATHHQGGRLERMAPDGFLDRRSRASWVLCMAFAVGCLPPAMGAVQDLNQATRAEIEAVRGVGVELADRLLKAREQEPFVDWADLRRRVKGVTRHALNGFKEARFQIRNRAPDDQK